MVRTFLVAGGDLSELFEPIDEQLDTIAFAISSVFCEAGAYGLPSITTNTGGVPEVVKDGENGFVLPYDARGDA